MSLSLVTAPAVEPLSLADAKLHLRVDASIHDEDALIEGLIVAAREYAETFTHRAFITQTWDLKLDGFPWTGSSCSAIGTVPIVLPNPPVQSITSVTYIDPAGATQTWSALLYDTDLPTGPTASRASLVPAYQQIYPVTRYVPNAATVRFVAGYGDTAKDVPASVVAAMKILIASWYDPGRAAIEVGLRAAAVAVPLTADALLWPYKAF